MGHFPISNRPHSRGPLVARDNALISWLRNDSEYNPFKIFSPSVRLSAYINRYIIIDCEDSRVNRILPDTAIVMSFRLKGIVLSLENEITGTLPRLAISGIRKSDRLINYQKGSSNLLVVFSPMGASAFVTEPLNELFEITAPLDALKGFRNASELEDKLDNANDNNSVIELVEDFLLSRFRLPKADALIAKAINQISHAHGNIRIKNLAEDLCISQDPLEKRFRRITGVSPKQFAHISRMKMVINDIRSSKYQDLSETVFNAGYFDLPHFHKDFKNFTGQTPGQFFEASVYW